MTRIVKPGGTVAVWTFTPGFMEGWRFLPSRARASFRRPSPHLSDPLLPPPYSSSSAFLSSLPSFASSSPRNHPALFGSFPPLPLARKPSHLLPLRRAPISSFLFRLESSSAALEVGLEWRRRLSSKRGGLELESRDCRERGERGTG